ncbi:hypothetical protein BGX33_008276 [Mortierella sp. NVP41]|nr:hypothetical protein BGX33_008276 [Mortierella sp. NVP41]
MDARARNMGPRNDKNNNDTFNKRAVEIPPPIVVNPEPSRTPKPTAKPKPKPGPKPDPKPTPNPPPPTTPTTTNPTVTLPTTTDGAPVDPTVTTPSVDPSATSHIPSGNSSGADPSTSNGSTSGPGIGAIIGIVAGVVVVLALVAGLMVRNRRKKRRGEEVYKAELYQQQRMMHDNQSSVLVSGRVPPTPATANRIGTTGIGATATAAAAATATGAGSRSKRAMNSSENDRESLAEDYRQQQEEHYQQQQPDWFAKKSPLEYYRQVPPIEQLLGGGGAANHHQVEEVEDNDPVIIIGTGGDKDEIELQHAGPSTISQGPTEIVAARSLAASTMQQNLHQYHHLQQLQQEQQKQQRQREQQYGREAIPLHRTQHTDSTLNSNHSNKLEGFNQEPATVVIPRQSHQQQQRGRRSENEPSWPCSGQLSPIRTHSPMGSVYADPRGSPATASSGAYPHPPPPVPTSTARPDSFYNTSNILNAAGEGADNDVAAAAGPTGANEDYEIDMTAYYRPPPPQTPKTPGATTTTPSGFYDFDITDSYNYKTNNNSSTNLGLAPETPSSPPPPPIPRATRPVSVGPPARDSSNGNGATGRMSGEAFSMSPYTQPQQPPPPPVPAIATSFSMAMTSSQQQSPVSPQARGDRSGAGPHVGGRIPRGNAATGAGAGTGYGGRRD